MDNQSAQIRKKAVISHHLKADLFAKRYKEMSGNPYASAFAYGRKKIFEFLFPLLEFKLRPGAEILDVGAGTGFLTRKLSEAGYNVKAVEPAQAMREKAKRLNPGVEVFGSFVSNLPFPDNSFDAVIALEVFRYLPKGDIIKGYSECLRILKPGGILFVTLANKYALDGFFFSYYLKLLGEKLFRQPLPNYCNFTTPRATKKIFKEKFGLEAKTYGVLFAPIRIVYKVIPFLGEKMAREIEGLDNWLSRKKWWQPFAGHLIAVVKKT
jgi:SAM-dependent methyltransferase